MNSNRFVQQCLLATAFFPCICDAQITRSFTEPIEIRQVAANQSDVLTELKVQEGSFVQKGDVIAELDNSVLKKNLLIACLRADSIAAVSGAKIDNDTNRKRYEKLQTMLEQGHANPAEVEKAEAEFLTSQASLEIAEEKKKEFQLEVDRINAEIERNIIRAPISGVITEVHCRPGEFIATNERKLVTIVCVDKLKVKFYLFDKDASKLAPNCKVRLRIGDAKDEIIGVVSYVSPVIDPESGTARVDVVIQNNDNTFRSGKVCYWPEEYLVGGLRKEKTSGESTSSAKEDWE